VKYTANSLRFVWRDLDVRTDEEYSVFKIRSYWTARCHSSDSLLLPNSCLSGTLKLVRRLSYYVIRYYALTFLCVVVSFIAFWLPTNAWPARVNRNFAGRPLMSFTLKANITVSPLLSLIAQDIAMNSAIGE